MSKMDWTISLSITKDGTRDKENGELMLQTISGSRSGRATSNNDLGIPIGVDIGNLIISISPYLSTEELDDIFDAIESEKVEYNDKKYENDKKQQLT